MKSPILPDYWKVFVESNCLVLKEIEFPWPGEDELTAIVEVYDDGNVEREANENWPGIGIVGDGFIPVAGCGRSSGDQFCININDGENGPLYLVDHESVGSDGYNRDEAVLIMLKSYKELLNYLVT